TSCAEDVGRLVRGTGVQRWRRGARWACGADGRAQTGHDFLPPKRGHGVVRPRAVQKLFSTQRPCGSARGAAARGGGSARRGAGREREGFFFDSAVVGAGAGTSADVMVAEENGAEEVEEAE